MFINDFVKDEIILKLNNIININDSKWNELDINLKTKIIHHYCNFFNKSNNSIINWNIINIPLKSIKPKKLIELTGINKNFNKLLFNDYNNLILKYTFDFRNKYLDKSEKKIYYNYSNLPKFDYNEILSNYNKIVYNFIINNKKSININKLYNNIIGSNTNKIITNIEPKNFYLNINENKIEFVFNNNVTILCELILVNDKITNNIPVKYYIKLINNL
jgi:hypothetical protein